MEDVLLSTCTLPSLENWPLRPRSLPLPRTLGGMKAHFSAPVFRVDSVEEPGVVWGRGSCPFLCGLQRNQHSLGRVVTLGVPPSRP